MRIIRTESNKKKIFKNIAKKRRYPKSKCKLKQPFCNTMLQREKTWLMIVNSLAVT